MNFPNYQERKDNGLITVRAHGSGRVSVAAANFDPTHEGRRLDDTVEVQSIDHYKRERDNLAQEVETHKSLLKDITALIADAEAADAEFTAPTKEKKTK